jgi:hypothetical protein
VSLLRWWSTGSSRATATTARVFAFLRVLGRRLAAALRLAEAHETIEDTAASAAAHRDWPRSRQVRISLVRCRTVRRAKSTQDIRSR